MNKKFLFGSAVRQSLIYMLLMGLIIGIVFVPLSQKFLWLPAEKVYTLKFFIITIASGLIVGSTSYFILKITILAKLKDFLKNIEFISKNILDYQTGQISSMQKCKNYYVKVNSNDIVGFLAIKYNSLIRVIISEFYQYDIVKEYSKIISETLQIEELNKNTVNFLCKNLDLFGIQIYKTTTNGKIALSKAKGVHTDLIDEMEKSLLDILDENKIREINGKQIVEYGIAKIKPNYVYLFPLKHLNKEWVFVTYSNYYMTKERKNLMIRVLNEYKIAYESADRYERMQNMASVDELTGLYNRRFGMKRLNEEYKRALRIEKCMCLIMFDIDHFKNINDTYGHQTGDYILSTIGKILLDSFRSEDVVMRYGGEEFLCVLCNSESEGAKKRAEEIRKKVEDFDFIYRDLKIKVTISGGISVFNINNNEEKKTPERLIREADEALYIAKRTGRNKVINYAPL